MDSTLKRREFFDLMGMGLALLAAPSLGACAGDDASATASDLEEAEDALGERPDPPGQHIAMLVYPEMTLLDLVGPHTCFQALGMHVHLVWKALAPIKSDSGISIIPTATFATCPKNVEILFVPGSSTGTAAVIRDHDALRFVKSRGENAKWVTSVCTGSLILGAAGLLRGYKASSHWSTRDLLPLVGAQRVDERFVHDRNRITGGGVTSGIDFGLRIVELLKSRQLAEVTQLMMEYAPQPPFNSGEPSTASPVTVGTVLALWAPLLTDARLALMDPRNRL